MKQITKRLFWLILSLSFILNSKAQTGQPFTVPTANSFSSYVPYNGTYSYGVNPGYYSSKWSSQNVADLASGNKAKNVKGAGVKSLRLPLYDDFLTKWGIKNLLNDFQYYASIGITEITAFVGSPDESHRFDTTFDGSPESSKVFKNLYEPVWLDDAKTIINPKNYYAKYLYDVVNTYGQYVKFWEIVNEPDFTYGTGGWSGDLTPPDRNSWFYKNPTANDLVNLRAPIFYYIRELRVAREVIKRISPNSYICTGGIGYKSFLDALLRNTDNPAGGSVTSNYPLKAGAYFDVLSFHCYPEFSLKTWDAESGQVKHFRHSDAGTDAYITIKNNLDNVMIQYGYDDKQYPKKQFICTETGVARIVSTGEDDWGSNEAQKNFMIKGQIASQINGIKQVYWYQLGDFTDPNQQFDQMGLYYYFGNSAPYSQVKMTDQGKALKTTSDLLYGKVYDAAKTAELKLTPKIDGAAFKGQDGSYVYVLWAKTKKDNSEDVSASYSFPKTISTGSVLRKEWDFSQTGYIATVTAKNNNLTATPSFFETPADNSTQQPAITLSANAGSDTTLVLPANSITLNGTATGAPDASITYIWSKISGPAQFNITSSNQAQATVSNMASGNYQFELKATDNLGNIDRDTITIGVVNSNQNNYSVIPSRIEAENFTAMNGVQAEATQDNGGGKNVGYIDPADWMDYNINVPNTGVYLISFRVASPAYNAQFQLKKSDGSVLTTVNVPNTGDFQKWQTVSVSVKLQKGLQTLRIFSTAPTWNSWNINWIDIAAKNADLHIEAESFNSMKGIQTENTNDDNGGQDVGYIDLGDNLAYKVSVPATGLYTVAFRISSAVNGAQFQLFNSNGSMLTSIIVPNTGGFQSWQTITANISLEQGDQTLKIISAAISNWNINWIELTQVSDPAVTASFRIEAEDYSDMNGIQTETTADVDGVQDVDYIDPWDWMNYSVNVNAAGTYSVDFRIASPNKNSQFELRTLDGSVLAKVNVPYTGGYQNWQTIHATVKLPQGQQTLRIISTGNKYDNWNINWWQLNLVNGLNTNASSINSSADVQRNIIPQELDSFVKADSDLVINPNPVKDNFVLHLNNNYTGKLSIEIIDMNARVQKRLFFIKSDKGDWEREIFIPGMPVGTYIIRAQIDKWSQSKMIIKQNSH